MRVRFATIPKNQAKHPDYRPITRTGLLNTGQSSGKTRDFPDKLAQHWAVIRKNTRFPGQTGSIRGIHPEKRSISRTGWLNTRQSSGKTRDFPDKLAQYWALIRKNTRFPGQVGSILGTHPEKHAISRTGLLNTGQSSETAQPHVNPSSDDIGDLPPRDVMPF